MSSTFNYRLGTPTNLPTDGTYDLLLINFPDSYPEGKIQFDLAETPRKITGIQKVAQTFMKVLFTSAGSNVLYPNQGTNFQALTINANISTSDSVFVTELSDQIKEAESQTKAILNSGSQDLAGQLQEISILGLDTSTEAAIIYLKLVTKAGAKAQVAVPFPMLDLVLSEDKTIS
jgi:hypothetical protein